MDAENLDTRKVECWKLGELGPMEFDIRDLRRVPNDDRLACWTRKNDWDDGS